MILLLVGIPAIVLLFVVKEVLMNIWKKL